MFFIRRENSIETSVFNWKDATASENVQIPFESVETVDNTCPFCSNWTFTPDIGTVLEVIEPVMIAGRLAIAIDTKL